MTYEKLPRRNAAEVFFGDRPGMNREPGVGQAGVPVDRGNCCGIPHSMGPVHAAEPSDYFLSQFF